MIEEYKIGGYGSLIFGGYLELHRGRYRDNKLKRKK